MTHQLNGLVPNGWFNPSAADPVIPFLADVLPQTNLKIRTPPYKFVQEYVVGFAFNEDATKVVLIRKNKPEWQVGLLNGVGGKVENTDAGIYSAMVREFREETGVQTKEHEWENFLTLRGDDYVLHCFRTFTDISNCKTTERGVIEVVDTYPLPLDTIPDLHWIVPLAIDDVEPFTAFVPKRVVH